MTKESLNNFEDKFLVKEEELQPKETALKDAALEEKETGREVRPGKIKKTAKQPWFQIAYDAKREFPQDVQIIIEKIFHNDVVYVKEHYLFVDAVSRWWEEQFGTPFLSKEKREEIARNRGIKIENKDEKYEKEKQNRMRRLHAALRQLDADEPIGEFEHVTRRKIFYDTHQGGFALNDNEEAGVLTLGDILSDYAWDIRYAPDFGRMQDAPHEARRIAKQILVNEARRDLETIYNLELSSQHQGTGGAQNTEKIFNRENGGIRNEEVGVVAEIMARETLARVSNNHDLGFAVFRANAIEDGLYKYDFKILAKEHKRGVEVEDEENFEKRLKSLGIQFTKGTQHKLHMILEVKQKYGVEIPVDDIVLIKILSDEFQDSFNAWMRLGKPSGGPEQFLSPKLKINLLQQATQGIVTIKKEALKHLFEKSNRKELNN